MSQNKPDTKTENPAVLFSETLSEHGIQLTRDTTSALQVNVGRLCNLHCGHCHLNAGPGRTEIMDAATVKEVIAYAEKCHFDTIDITGGAPEMNPNINKLIEDLVPLASNIMFRSNLTAIESPGKDRLLDILAKNKVIMVASFPSINEAQANAQRGDGIFLKSIDTLKKLNDLGYGEKDTGLELNLVSNPAGAFLPSPQEATEKRFKQVLANKWGISFNSLFSFANVPLGRFRSWLVNSGNLEKYIETLSTGFNPCAIDKLMCRTMVSVSWDGLLYDCDFNIAGNLFMDGQKKHISEMPGPPEPGTQIAVGDHCYACTAGTGFT